ncbi:MAG: 3-dehydroquinate synthase [Flavobacteriaceae bacterium]|nr:3-dehydroquinate synthase [Flavobacteriaceae bacterium]
MRSIQTLGSRVYFYKEAFSQLQQHLQDENYSTVFILVDENTRKDCLPLLTREVDMLENAGILQIASGEENKNISSCMQLWDTLSRENADRKSLLINLGGGVLTDLGGFVASTFKRGIAFINIPTTLLAMVDASVGGKTGVDLGTLKNQVGVITEPAMVLVIPQFLGTLEKRQLTSGFAEMLKHGLIQDPAYWSALGQTDNMEDLEAHIHRSVSLKNKVVQKDPTEKNERKILNFGHTLGHAVESYFLKQEGKDPLLHGEAIAIGMILEAYLSHKLTGLPEEQLSEIKRIFQKYFERITFSAEDIESIISLLRYDKKNSHGKVNFVLLKSIGEPVIDVQVPDELLRSSFTYYME